MKYFIKGDYYFDIDVENQFRLTGPENHLFLGFKILTDCEVEITHYELDNTDLIIKIIFKSKKISLSKPLVCDIRTLRNFTEPIVPHPTYDQLIKKDIPDILPTIYKKVANKSTETLSYLREYMDDQVEKFYGATLTYSKEYSFSEKANQLTFESSTNEIELEIRTQTNIVISEKYESPLIFNQYAHLDPQHFSPFLLDLYHKTAEQISYLVTTKRTSSFEYGTIFPRDWIESACLGSNDFDENVVDYMFYQSMKHVSEIGEGWHEDIIGEFKVKTQAKEHIDRKMIDIEPLYLMGLNYVSKQFIFDEQNLAKLKAVAAYVIKNARQQHLITFKKVSNLEQFHQVGNWRDSIEAYPNQKSPVAPYDVNCVFYPKALRVISQFNLVFSDVDRTELNELIAKWDKNKDAFRMHHPDDVIGYALALHGRKRLPLPVSHLDESYDLFFAEPSLEEVHSFALKLNDPEYFYTPVGPLLVAADTDGMTTKNYHGKVTWPKQAAFAIAGLATQYRRGLKESWPQPLLDTIKESALNCSEACFKAFEQLQAVPELYYYSEKENRPRFYTDQENVEAQMSLIQLWSAVGTRRIMHEYQFLKKN